MSGALSARSYSLYLTPHNRCIYALLPGCKTYPPTSRLLLCFLVCSRRNKSYFPASETTASFLAHLATARKITPTSERRYWSEAGGVLCSRVQRNDTSRHERRSEVSPIPHSNLTMGLEAKRETLGGPSERIGGPSAARSIAAE